MATIKDVSKLAGVSTSTVSRVLCNNGFVSEEARKQVLDAVQQLGYRPNSLAQGLKNRRSNIIGVVVPDISSPYFAHMLSGVELAVELAGMNMLVCSGHADLKSETQAIESLLRHRCDALILHVEATLRTSNGDLSTVIPNNVPFVMMGLNVPQYAEHAVYTDNEMGGFLATDYLISQGHRNIAHFIGPLNYSDSRARLSGYKRALQEAKIDFRDEYIFEGEDYTEEFGYRATGELIKRQLPFSAIFAGDDDIAVGVVLAMRDHQLQIPGDISLVGFDDMFYARLTHPPLTTIRQPILDMGRTAGELAIHRLSGKGSAPAKRVFAPELVVRSSVGRGEGYPGAERTLPEQLSRQDASGLSEKPVTTQVRRCKLSVVDVEACPL